MCLCCFKDFNKEAYECFSTKQKYCAAALGDYDGVKENLEEVGIPFDLWDVYKERFNYTIKIDFENNKIKLDSAYTSYEFTNTDFLYDGDNSPLTMKARPFHIGFIWLVDHYKYTGEFYFDEEEVINVFREAFNQEKRKKKGVLHIHISKYNNKFDIYLLVDGKQYPLTKTMIHVFRETPKHKKEEDLPFYNNHEDIYSGDIHYIGG